MTPSRKLEELGLTLPTPARPVGSYLPALRTGSLVFTSGQLPMTDGKLCGTGAVDAKVSLEDAQQSARIAVLNALSAAASECGGLDAISRIVRMNVYVQSSEGFTDQAKVANAASDLLVDIFGEPGRHTRCALGAAALPLDSPVELDLIVEVSPSA